MKNKVWILLTMAIFSLPRGVYAASSETLEDTSILRISAPEQRAHFLTTTIVDFLELDGQDAEVIRSINLKYERLFQQFSQQYPKVVDKKAMKEFQSLSEGRDKELKKALASEDYREYSRQRLNLRIMFMEQMNKEYVERQRMYREQEERQKREEQLRIADSIAQAQKAAADAAKAKKQKNGKNTKGTPKSAPKSKKKK